MTDSSRTPREAATRAKTQRRKPWAPPSKLEAPEAPAGYKHRWIRTAIRGEDLDAAKAAEAKRRAEEHIQNQHGDMDFAQAASELAKAIAKLRVIELVKKRR